LAAYGENDLARRTLQPEQLQPTLRLDAEITPKQLTIEQLAELGRLQQTGMGNPPVQLLMRGVTQQRPCQRMGVQNKHARLWVTDGRVTCEAVI